MFRMRLTILLDALYHITNLFFITQAQTHDINDRFRINTKFEWLFFFDGVNLFSSTRNWRVLFVCVARAHCSRISVAFFYWLDVSHILSPCSLRSLIRTAPKKIKNTQDSIARQHHTSTIFKAIYIQIWWSHTIKKKHFYLIYFYWNCCGMQREHANERCFERPIK